jgi:hypothetical protein
LRNLATKLKTVTADLSLLTANLTACREDLAKYRALVETLTKERDEAVKRLADDRAKTLDLVLEHDRVVQDRDILERRLQLQHVYCMHCGQDFGEHERGAHAPEVREHVISCSEHPLAKERDAARAEVERVRPVYEAAKAWLRESLRKPTDGLDFKSYDNKKAELVLAIDAALADESKEK